MVDRLPCCQRGQKIGGNRTEFHYPFFFGAAFSWTQNKTA